MCTNLTLGQSDSLDELLYGIEFERSQSQLTAYLVHHLGILRRVGSCIFVEILISIALKLLDNAACDKLHIALGRCEIDERTAVNQRRTSYTHVEFLKSCIEQTLHIVAQLGATYDRVVAEQHTLAIDHSLVWYEFHLGNKRSHGLV